MRMIWEEMGIHLMEPRELKKLTRTELLELLLEQTKRADDLEQRLQKAEQLLADKLLLMEDAGSIAEASLRLNHVFEAAQAAADQYLESVKTLRIRQEALRSDHEADTASSEGSI